MTSTPLYPRAAPSSKRLSGSSPPWAATPRPTATLRTCRVMLLAPWTRSMPLTRSSPFPQAVFSAATVSPLPTAPSHPSLSATLVMRACAITPSCPPSPSAARGDAGPTLRGGTHPSATPRRTRVGPIARSRVPSSASSARSQSARPPRRRPDSPSLTRRSQRAFLQACPLCPRPTASSPSPRALRKTAATSSPLPARAPRL
mmetsp:Transcript_2772/g.7944  ORF Transcript_2772/g.7944 Transcript_2772/m.7944 type:complete len:202 (-) Transcript_2772:412-1017(-)